MPRMQENAEDIVKHASKLTLVKHPEIRRKIIGYLKLNIAKHLHAIDNVLIKILYWKRFFSVTQTEVR